MTTLECTVQMDGHDIAFVLSGELDLAGRDVLSACLDQIGTAYGRVYIDLGDVSFVDSNGLNLLARTGLQLQQRSCELLVLNARASVRRAFTVVGMDRFLRVE